MNKKELTDAVAESIGDKKTAAAAVDAVLETIRHTVASGEKVAIFGFGSFERVQRPARDARNPATGAIILSRRHRCRSSSRARTSRSGSPPVRSPSRRR